MGWLFQEAFCSSFRLNSSSNNFKALFRVNINPGSAFLFSGKLVIMNVASTAAYCVVTRGHQNCIRDNLNKKSFGRVPRGCRLRLSAHRTRCPGGRALRYVAAGKSDGRLPAPIPYARAPAAGFRPFRAARSIPCRMQTLFAQPGP